MNPDSSADVRNAARRRRASVHFDRSCIASSTSTLLKHRPQPLRTNLEVDARRLARLLLESVQDVHGFRESREKEDPMLAARSDPHLRDADAERLHRLPVDRLEPALHPMKLVASLVPSRGGETSEVVERRAYPHDRLGRVMPHFQDYTCRCILVKSRRESATVDSIANGRAKVCDASARPTRNGNHMREKHMNHKQLDTVVLSRDLPEFGLRAGDVGAVVFVLSPDAVEVEFVSGSGDTIAVVTLPSDEVRAVADEEVLAVRAIRRSA